MKNAIKLIIGIMLNLLWVIPMLMLGHSYNIIWLFIGMALMIVSVALQMSMFKQI